MSDETSEPAANTVNDWNRHVIDEFRGNHGQVGGRFAGAPVLLLHTTGARSGAERVNPMMYLELDERLFVFASKAGAHTHPDWYHNLKRHPQVTVELGDDTFSAIASPVGHDERGRVYAVQAERFPNFAEYETKTHRVIPVVELSRT
ncbi:MAG: nitroreductase family deazaflavin-dependent oxidoreductase [Acidimicrobiales bacterium]